MVVLTENSTFDRRIFLSVLGLGLLGAAARVRADGEPIAVVVGAKSSQKELSLSALRRIFLNLPTDDNDRHRFMPINALPKSPLRVGFDQVVLGMDSQEVGRYWVDQGIRGVQAPRVVPELNLVRGLVAKWRWSRVWTVHGTVCRMGVAQDVLDLQLEHVAPGQVGVRYCE